jgi:serine/threonine protein kinase
VSERGGQTSIEKKELQSYSSRNTLTSCEAVEMLLIAALLAISVVHAMAPPGRVAAINPRSLVLGDFIASGRYGTVCWALVDGVTCVAKRAASSEEMAQFTSPDQLRRAAKRSVEYLETEGEVQRLIMERTAQYSSCEIHEQTLAPFLGSCVKEGRRYLVWRACGTNTLDDYLVDDGRSLPELALSLGCSEAALPRRVLHDVLRCLAHVHSCGIAHRDVKPPNLLVDADAQTLRLIDFGSAADCAGWLDHERRGLRADRISASMLFTPTSKEGRPRSFDDRAGWYQFDIYAAALVWLCVAVPKLADEYKGLHELRAALEAHGHDANDWRSACDEGRSAQQDERLPPERLQEECAVPMTESFEKVFGWHAPRPEQIANRAPNVAAGGAHASDSALAWELLTGMLNSDGTKRPSAAEALIGRYLNEDCMQEELSMPPPEPWTIEGLLGALGAGTTRRAVADECAVGVGN